MHIRFSLAEADETPGVLIPDVDVALQTDCYSTHLRSVWSAFLFSFLSVRPEKVLQQPTGIEPTHIVHDTRHATAAATSSAVSPEASVKAQTAQPFNAPEQLPVRKTVSDAQAANEGKRSYALGGDIPSCSTALLQVVALSGLEALMQSTQDWSQLAHETYQACVWTFSQAAKQYVICSVKSRRMHTSSMADVQPQILVISE